MADARHSAGHRRAASCVGLYSENTADQGAPISHQTQAYANGRGLLWTDSDTIVAHLKRHVRIAAFELNYE